MALADHLDWARERVDALLAAGDGPRLVAVAVASLDLRAGVAGRSGGLSSEADQALLYAWRAAADMLLVGGRTLTVERYGSLLPEPLAARRRERGLPPIPPVATISRAADLDVARIRRADEPPDLRVYTEAAPPPDEPGVGWRRLKAVTVRSVVDDLRERGAGVIVCEGGPTVYARALADEVVTDLSLTLAPVVVGEGDVLLPDFHPGDVRLALAGATAIGDHLFTHYRVRAQASRSTTR
ncbi:MAG TPA: dihydrofolate reductase family protein [Baekduia sp.]|nr:dihydrofolate reductase family protein [Baekduia sp.]